MNFPQLCKRVHARPLRCLLLLCEKAAIHGRIEVECLEKKRRALVGAEVHVYQNQTWKRR